MGKKRSVLFTGGGSAGHVIPNVALISEAKNRGWSSFYIGSKKGMERKIVARAGAPYFSVMTGKLRRYFSWRNFLDPFKILFGICQAFFLCRRINPDVVFSKGGFVAFPVVFAAWLRRIPVVMHESDLTPGLANRLSLPFVKTVCVTFPAGAEYFSKKKSVVVTGTPVRSCLLKGDAEKGRNLCGFSGSKEILLVYGGGLGAEAINKAVRKILPKLLKDFQVAHICGEGKLCSGNELVGYKQFEYLYDEFADVMACADFVISRAGANTLYELLTLKKPHIVIPLPKFASRGDQIDNARYFLKQGLSQVLYEEKLTPEKLLAKLLLIRRQRDDIVRKMQGFKKSDSVTVICDILAKL